MDEVYSLTICLENGNCDDYATYDTKKIIKYSEDKQKLEDFKNKLEVKINKLLKKESKSYKVYFYIDKISFVKEEEINEILSDVKGFFYI